MNGATMARPADDEITGGEAARLLGMTRQHVSRLALDGKLPGWQLAGRYWIFKRADVEAYARSIKPKGGRPRGPILGRTTRTPPTRRHGAAPASGGNETTKRPA